MKVKKSVIRNSITTEVFYTSVLAQHEPLFQYEQRYVPNVHFPCH